MNKSTFLTEVEQIKQTLTTEQQALIPQMLTTLATYEEAFTGGEWYAKKVKDNSADNPIHSFSVGIKLRPLHFVRVTLNLETNELKLVQSELIERTVSLPPRVAPDGSTVYHLPQTFIASKQAITCIN